MLLALLLRVFRYRVAQAQTLLSGYAGYAYWVYTLLIPAITLCLFGLTNDFHRLIYIPRAPLSAFALTMQIWI